MTYEEKHLWYDFLKKLPMTVSRQKIFYNYIVDFYIASHNIVIELDGKQHFEQKAYEEDRIRDTFLQDMGKTVLRYKNTEVNKNFNAVCNDICKHIGVTLEEVFKR